MYVMFFPIRPMLERNCADLNRFRVLAPHIATGCLSLNTRVCRALGARQPVFNAAIGCQFHDEQSLNQSLIAEHDPE